MNAASIDQHILFPPPIAQGIARSIVQTIVTRERHAFRRSSCLRMRQAASARYRPRRQTVVVEGSRWDKESFLRVNGLDVHAFANDVRTDDLDPVDECSSSHVRRWEGEFVVRVGGIPHVRASWYGTNGSVDVSMFDFDDETISDAQIRDILKAIAEDFGCPEDIFGVERVKHDDLWRAHPPDAVHVRI